MSQQIDNQIVKMQFDNASFEKNVKESMGTIDKLKAALKFDDSSKGLEGLEKQLSSMDMSKLSDACDAVTKKFSFLGTVADQILRDITTKVASTAEKLVKSFTIDQVSAGWEKYAEKTTAVQTIMANTIKDVGEGKKWKDQAEQMAAVTEQIEKLNWFTDETSYSLTDMTNNIGKFVAQSVGLEDAADAMMGISTWAAISGQNKTQAQMAMYNLSQSLGAGAVKAIDWKSIENANMATAEFKQTVIDTAKALGVLNEKSGVINEQFITAAKYSGPAAVSIENFRETLSAGWFNSDVLMKSLEKYGGFANKMNELYNVVNRNGMVSTTSNLLKVLDELGSGSEDAAKHIETLAKNSDIATEDLQKLFDELNKPEYDLGKRAFAAAQEAKTFQEAIDATSDAVASEFMGIFEAIFGNYLEAKELWTDLANSLWDIFAGPLDNIKWALIEWKGMQTLVFDDVKKQYNVLSGREVLLDAFAKGIENIAEALEIVRSALAEVFPIFNVFVTEGDDAFDTTEGAKAFMGFTKTLHAFAESLKLSEDAANSLHNVVHVLAVGIKIVANTIGSFFQGIFKLVGPLFNIADAIFGLVGKIISALTGNDTIIGFADMLNAGAGKINDVYLAIMDKVAWVLNKIADIIRGFPDSEIFDKITEGVRHLKEQVSGLWDSFVEMPVIQEMIADFWRLVDKLDRALTPMFNKIKDGAESAGKTITSYLNFDSLNKGITFLYKKLKLAVSTIKDFATRLKSFFDNIKSGKSIVDSFKDSFGNVVEWFRELRTNITTFFEELKEQYQNLNISETLQTIADGIHNFVANITPEQVTMLAIAGGFMLIALNLLRLSDALTDAVTAFAGIGKSIKKVIDSYVKKQQTIVMQVAESIIMVAGALWVLSTIPKDKLENATGAIWGVVGALSVLLVVSTVCAAVLKKMQAGSMTSMAAGVVILTSAFMVAALSLKVLETVDIDGVMPKVLIVTGILAALAILAALIRKLDSFAKGSLTMIAIAGAMLVVALALAKIAEIPQEKMESAMDGMLKIMIGLAALSYASGKVGLFSAVGIIAIVLTMDKILPMIEKLVNYDFTNIENGIDNNKEALKKLGGLVLVMVAIGAIAGNRLKSAGIAMITVAGALAIFVGITKLVTLLKPNELQRGEDFMFKMVGMIALLQLCSKKAEKGSNSYKGLLALPIALGGCLLIVKLASMMEPEGLVKGELALLGLVAIVTLMIKAANDAQKAEGSLKAVATILFAVSAILAMVALLSMIPFDSMLPALGVVLAVMGMLSLLAFAVSLSVKTFNTDKEKAVSGLGGIIAAIAAVVFVTLAIVTLSKLEPSNVAAAGASIMMAIAAIALLMTQVNKISQKTDAKIDIKKTLVSVIGSLVMVALIAQVIGALAKQLNGVDFKTILASAGAIAIVMLAILPALKVMSTMSKDTHMDYAGIATSVGLAVGALAAVAGAIWVLSNFGGDGVKMIQAATALAIGLIAICVPILVLGFVRKLLNGIQPAALVGPILGAIFAVGAISAALIALTRLGDTSGMIEAATALAIGLVAICIPMAVLAAISNFINGANVLPAIGILVAAVAAFGAVAYILYQFSNSIDESAIQRINDVMPSLLLAIAGISALCFVIVGAGILSGGGAAILPGIGVLVAAIVAFGILVAALTGLGAAFEKWDSLYPALVTGLDILVLVFEKIGEALGKILSGFVNGMADGLEGLGNKLIRFSEQMGTFSENLTTGVSPELADTCKSLASALLVLCGAEVLGAIADFMKFFTGNTRKLSFEVLGEGVADFADAVAGISENSLTKAIIAAKIAEQLANIQGALGTKGGIKASIFGDKQSLDDFGLGIKKFAQGLKAFVDVIKDLSNDAMVKSQLACNACQPMLDITAQLSNHGGLIQGLLGEKDLGDFGNKLKTFAEGLKGFVQSLKYLEGNYSNYPELIKKCADATVPMVDLANSLENMGGKIANIIGDNTLDKFGSTLIPFIMDFDTFVGKIHEIYENHPNLAGEIKGIANATKELIDLANSLQNMGGMVSWFTGDNTLKQFGDTLVDFGKGLKKFDKETIDTDPSKWISIIESTYSLIALCQNAAEQVTVDSLTGLETSMGKLIRIFGQSRNMDASSFKVFGENISTGIANGMDGAFEALLRPKIANLIATINGIFVFGMTVQNYNLYGKNIVEGIRSAIVLYEGELFARIGAMITSIKTKLGNELAESKFIAFGANITNGIAAGIRRYHDNVLQAAYELGAYVAEGVRKGIEEHQEEAIDAARAMAEAVNAITANTFQESSPSKVAYRYGMYYDMGLANGITDYSASAVSSAEEMADNIVSGANSIITAIREAMDENIDTEPVIRPVLDTSDISRKAGSIGKLFNADDLQMAYNASSTMKQAHGTKPDTSEASTNEVIGGNQINFTQNNYSPKALSRMDIYRQTKNQINMMKGVVKGYA